MKRICLLALALASPAFAAPTAFAADEGDAKARQIAEKVTTEGAAIFDTFDARAMAATYDEKGVLTVFRREKESIEREAHEGRAKVEAAYAELFKSPETIKSRNVVEHARLIAPDLLTIDGTFDLNTLKPDSIKVPFHQVRQQKGGKWLVLSMEISLVPHD
ncbi:MAG: hypothetical protein BGO49_02265 [Planctomycetales bacterium 71-10]|nr:MAG: hypothetical protein BGO49_02265 [Planctomycetales bacterium 71-10]